MQAAELIKLMITEGNGILLELNNMRKTIGAAINVNYYVDEDVEKCRKQINKWQMTSKDILISKFGETHRYVSSFEKTMSNKDKGFDYKKEYYFEVNQGLSVLESISETLKLGLNTSVAMENMERNKTPKVFISHKSEDKAYAEALVDLINFIIGSEGDKIFCSSVPGYGVKQAHTIIDDLKAQFDNHNIYMIIIHSPRYYESAICLNEMGAAWVLGTEFSSFMTTDCDYDQMCGVINQKSKCINFKDDIKTLNAHLNDFKNDLILFFSTSSINENKWENARDKFVKEVTAIINVPKCENNTNLFESLYIPAFDHIFQLLELEHFPKWAYKCAISSETVLSKSIYNNLVIVVKYIKSRPKHSEYKSWDSLLQNLGLLICDFNIVFSQHAVKFGENGYYVEQFYKRIPRNPNYDVDLDAYNQHIFLVSDIVFEIARLCNLILSKIREQYPEYKKELGLLYIGNDFSSPDLIYKDEELSDAPYPGIKEFIKVRLTRETHYGNNPRIDIDGYGEAK